MTVGTAALTASYYGSGSQQKEDFIEHRKRITLQQADDDSEEISDQEEVESET